MSENAINSNNSDRNWHHLNDNDNNIHEDAPIEIEKYYTTLHYTTYYKRLQNDH